LTGFSYEPLWLGGKMQQKQILNLHLICHVLNQHCEINDQQKPKIIIADVGVLLLQSWNMYNLLIE
jgi:hypothetical protein